MLGTILKQQGATAEALTAFRNAVKYSPTSAEAYLSLGQTLGQAGQQAEAAAMQEAERLNRRKADEQASTFAVAVGVQKLRPTTSPGPSSGSAKRSAFRRTTPAHVTSSRSRCNGRAPAERRRRSLPRLAVSRRTAGSAESPAPSSDRRDGRHS